MKVIKLTKGRFTLVDDQDHEKFSKVKWCVSNGYTARGVGGRKNRKTLLLHKEIMGTPKGMDTDHINGDKLDNRRENLRVATRSQNMANLPNPINNKSGYKGVIWYKRDSNWRAFIKVNYKQVHLGYFKDKVEAAKAYNLAALEKYGEYAFLNPV